MCGRRVTIVSLRKIEHTEFDDPASCGVGPYSSIRNPRCVPIDFFDLGDPLGPVSARRTRGATPVRLGGTSGTTIAFHIRPPEAHDPRPTVSLSASPNPVDEGQPVTVTATLSAPADDRLYVEFGARDETAEDGDRESRREWTVWIEAGSSSGSAQVATHRDDDLEDETFRIILDRQSVPESHVPHAENTEAVVTIRDVGALPPEAPETSGPHFVDCGSGARRGVGTGNPLDFFPSAWTAGATIGDVCYSASASGFHLGAWSADGQSWRGDRQKDAEAISVGSERARGSYYQRTLSFRTAEPDHGGGTDGRAIFDARLSSGDSEYLHVRVGAGGATFNAVAPGTAFATAPRQPPRVGAGAAEAAESSGSIEFSVTLDRAADEPVSVDWATADGTARAGADYAAASGTLAFPAGATSRTVAVALLDDAIDEGSETFTLRLSNARPSGAVRLGDASATGTITNSDPLQTAWLARLGRAVAAETVDALGDRIERRAQARSAAGDADLSLLTSLLSAAPGGTGLSLPTSFLLSAASGDADLSLLTSFLLSAASGSGTPGHLTGGGATGGGADLRADPLGHPRAGTSGTTGMAGIGAAGLGGMAAGGFPGGGMPAGADGAGPGGHLPSGTLFLPGAGAGGWTGWARTSTGHFSSFGGPLPLHGQMRMGIFGGDYELGRLLAGVAVAHGRGEGAATPAGLDRSYAAQSTLTSVHPYAAFDLSQELTVWGQAGYGRGGMSLIESFVGGTGPAQAGIYRTDNALAMAAGGVRGELPEIAGFAFAVRSDAFLVRTASAAVTAPGAGNLAAGAAGASRLRAVLESSRSLAFAGGRRITPSIEIGVRQDGGDAETGLGLETGFGIVYAEPGLGLMVDATISMLVAHQDGRYDEWGFSGSVRFDPGAAGRGLTLSITPSFGASAQGADRLWAMQDVGALMPYGGVPFDTGGHFAADLGYGMAGLGGRGTGTPYAGLTQSGMGYRSTRYGYRWEVGRFNLGVEGAREGGFGGYGVGESLVPFDGGHRFGGAQHSVRVNGGVSF